MGERKTVFQLNWNPSPVSVIVFVASLAALIYVPYWFQIPVFLSALMALPLELVLAAGIVWFFYHGLELVSLVKIFFLFLAIFSLLGFASNLFYQSTFLLSSRTLSTDGFIIGMLNAGAIAVTLSSYKLKAIKVDAESLAVAPTEPWVLKVRPIALSAAIAVLTIWLMCDWTSLIVSDSFAVNIIYFIGTQLLFNVGGTFYFFRSKPRIEKIKLSFLVIAIATGLGTLSNLVHHHTLLRPGDRLELRSMDFMIMNAGALIIVLAYELWSRHLKSEQEKYAARLAAFNSPSAPAAAKSTKSEKPHQTDSSEKSNSQEDAAKVKDSADSTGISPPASGEKVVDEEKIATPTDDSKPVEAEQGINK